MAFNKFVWVIFTFTVVQLCSSDASNWSTESVCQPSEFTVDGNVTIVVLVSLHENEGGKCGKIKADDFKFAASLKWAVEKLNSQGQDFNGFIPGVKIGLKIVDDCGLKLRSVKFAADAMFDMMSCDLRKSSAPVAGFIALGNDEQVEGVSGVVKGSGTPVIAALATSSRLNNTSLYPNLLRTALSDFHEAKVMFQVARELDWSYVALVYSSDAYDKNWLEYIKELATRFGVCFVLEKAMFNNTSADATGIIKSLSMKVRKTQENRLGVFYFGQFKKARLLLETQKELGFDYPDAHKLLWMMPSGVGRRVSDPRIRKSVSTAAVITLESEQVELPQFRNFFGQLLASPIQSEPNNTWDTLTKEFLQTYHCGEKDKSVSGCGLSGHPATPNKSTALPGQFRSILDAVYSLTVSLKSEHRKQCRDKPGVCIGLRKSLQNNFASTVSGISLKYDMLPEAVIPTDTFKERVVSFDNNGMTILSPETPLYTLHYTSKSKPRKIGTTTLNKVTLSKKANKSGQTTSLFSSSCEGTDSSCILDEELLFSYIPGDVLILGVFPLRTAGSKFNCEGYNTNIDYYTAYEAFTYAIIKEQLSYGTKIRVGGVAIDDCMNHFYNDYLMSQIFSGKRKLVDKDSGDVIDITKIVLVIGGYTSDTSIRMADLLTRLRIPQISYASSSVELDDRKRFPYFLRVVPSDSTMIAAMASTIKTLGITYVSFVYTDDIYGTNGMQSFISIASQYGICVADPIMVSTIETPVTEMDNVVRTLSHNWASAVVFIGNKARAKNLLDAVKKGAEEGQFFFFTCSRWSKPSWVLAENRGEFAKGSFSVEPNDVNNFSIELSSFPEHLMTISPTECRQCTWTKHFWQHHFRCNIERGFENVYNKTCGQDLHLSKKMADDLIDDSYLPVAVIHAVTAGVRSVEKTLEGFCPNQRVYPCPKYFKYINETVKNITNTSLAYSHGKQFRPFTNSGNGNIDFVLYNLQRQGFTLDYKLIGGYKDGKLTLDREAVKVYDKFGHPKSIVSVCQRGKMCEKCQTNVSKKVQDHVSVPSEDPEPEGTINTTIFILVVTALSVVILVGVVIKVFPCCREYRIVRRKSTGKSIAKGVKPVQPEADQNTVREWTDLRDIGRLPNSPREMVKMTEASSSLFHVGTHSHWGAETENQTDSQNCHCHRCFSHQRPVGHDSLQTQEKRRNQRDRRGKCLSSGTVTQTSLSDIKCALYIQEQQKRKPQELAIPKASCPQCNVHQRDFTHVDSNSINNGSISPRNRTNYRKVQARKASTDPITYSSKHQKRNCCRCEEQGHNESFGSSVPMSNTSEAVPVRGVGVRGYGKAESHQNPNVVNVNAQIHNTKQQENINNGENGPACSSVIAEVNVSWTKTVDV